MNKLFGEWNLDELEIHDPGIRNYVSFSPILFTDGRYTKHKFDKSNMSLVERLINNLMRSEHNTGKKTKSYNIAKRAFRIIHAKSRKNPLQVLVNAIENTAPREEIVRLKMGGISVPKAVDVVSQRRVDLALRFITKGAIRSSFKNKRGIEECLASEIIAASKYDVKCYSIDKKESIERVARAAR